MKVNERKRREEKRRNRATNVDKLLIDVDDVRPLPLCDLLDSLALRDASTRGRESKRLDKIRACSRLSRNAELGGGEARTEGGRRSSMPSISSDGPAARGVKSECDGREDEAWQRDPSAERPRVMRWPRRTYLGSLSLGAMNLVALPASEERLDDPVFLLAPFRRIREPKPAPEPRSPRPPPSKIVLGVAVVVLVQRERRRLQPPWEERQVRRLAAHKGRLRRGSTSRRKRLKRGRRGRGCFDL